MGTAEGIEQVDIARESSVSTVEKNRFFERWHRESDHNRAICSAARQAPQAFITDHLQRLHTPQTRPGAITLQPRRSSEISLWRTHVTSHRSEMLCLRTLAELTMLAVRIFPELRIARGRAWQSSTDLLGSLERALFALVCCWLYRCRSILLRRWCAVVEYAQTTCLLRSS